MESLLSEYQMVTEEIERAYRQATGQWTGCDWPSEFDINGLNLNGLKSSQALLLVRATSGSEREAWRAAVSWLAHIEQKAREAEEEASQAVTMARSSKLQEAFAHAQRACTIEAKYHARLVWQPLREAIEAGLSVVS